MQTVMTTSNGYDAVLLVDDDQNVVSAWMADREIVGLFLDDGTSPDEWSRGEWYNFTNPAGEPNEDELRTIAAYGEECGRNGVIANRSRREFWTR